MPRQWFCLSLAVNSSSNILMLFSPFSSSREARRRKPLAAVPRILSSRLLELSSATGHPTASADRGGRSARSGCFSAGRCSCCECCHTSAILHLHMCWKNCYAAACNLKSSNISHAAPTASSELRGMFLLQVPVSETQGDGSLSG